MKVEFIEWIDSGFSINDGWEPVVKSLGNFKYGDLKVLSAGLVVYEDSDVVALSTTFSPKSEQAFGLQLIVKSNILSREVLTHVES